MPACLPSVYLFVGALFLFWPGSGNLAGAVEGGRSAETGELQGRLARQAEERQQHAATQALDGQAEPHT